METGHNKNVTNFDTLIIACTGFGAPYNPSNPNIAIEVLVAQHLEAKASIREVKTTETPFNSVEGQRKIIFKPLKPTSTKVLNALKGASAPATVIADAETINRKIQGKRADNKTTETPEGQEPSDRNSVSQQSYDMQIDNFEKLIELAKKDKIAQFFEFKSRFGSINNIIDYNNDNQLDYFKVVNSDKNDEYRLFIENIKSKKTINSNSYMLLKYENNDRFIVIIDSLGK